MPVDAGASAGTAGAGAAHRWCPLLAAAAVLLLAANLRTTVASLPPLLDLVRTDLRLDAATAGLLTSLPVLCMAWASPACRRLLQRAGAPSTALAAAALVGVGNALRATPDGVAPVVLGTAVAGLGVAAGGVVLPALVKQLLPDRAGAATAAYTVAMMLGAAGAAAAAVPLADRLGSWRLSLAAWAVPAVLAAAALAATTPRPAAARRAGRDAVGPVSDRRALPWRSRPAWLLAAYLAAQSSLAYAALAWLPTWHIATGGTPGGGGAVLAVHNVAQLVAALGVPVLADRCADRRTVLVPVLLCSVAGTVWLVAFPGSLTLVAAVVLGAGLGAGFALGLTLVVDLAADPPAAAALAAFVFLLCYSVAAAAPVTVGVLADVVGLRAALAGLVVVAVVQLALATRLGPGHDGTVTCRVLRGHRRRQRVERPTR